MPRLSYVGALLALGALGCAPVSAQTSPQTSAKSAATNRTPSARVQHIIVRGTGDATEVEIQTSGAPVAPDTQAITGPDRIVVDFPGALPAAELGALKVNRGALKGVRSGLFFSNPPITRVVLDLTEPQAYKISALPTAIVVRLNSAKLEAAKSDPAAAAVAKLTKAPPPQGPPAPAAMLQNTALVAGASVAAPRAVAVVSQSTVWPVSAVSAPLPPMPFVTVTVVKGMLRIRSEKATLAQVLFEVQRQTHAEIAIPAGAEREEVIADLGPAPARDVLAALLNGTPYNFIFVGNELSLERVILTLRQPN